MILLIRHAEKSLIGEQDLTTKGLDDALNYGKKLQQQGMQFDEIISSPVKRCMQTAEKVAEGLNSSINIQKSHLLGDPGIFIADDKKAAKAFEQFTICEVINIIVNRKKLSGFVPIDKACKLMIDEIQTKINLDKSILYISHDAVIMPFIAYILETNVISESEIINYLDGYFIEQSHENRVKYNAKLYELYF